MPVALVTGAAKRLGAAMALDLAEQGFDVAVHYSGSKNEAEAVARAIRETGQNAKIFQADLTDEVAIADLVPTVLAEMDGPITCLVNNASIFEYDTIETATRTSWDRHMMTNLRAPFVLTQAVAEQLPDPVSDKNGEPVAQGLVVNMVDQRVRKLTPEFMTYTMAKIGLWAFTQTAAQGLAPKCRVNAIGPGPTLIGSRQSQNHFDTQRGATVLKRGSDPEDIVAALRYFISAKAVTGQLICVDGGQHLGWKTPDVQGVE